MFASSGLPDSISMFLLSSLDACTSCNDDYIDTSFFCYSNFKKLTGVVNVYVDY